MMTVMMEGARPPMAPPTGCAPIISTGNLPKIAEELPETEGGSLGTYTISKVHKNSI